MDNNRPILPSISHLINSTPSARNSPSATPFSWPPSPERPSSLVREPSTGSQLETWRSERPLPTTERTPSSSTPAPRRTRAPAPSKRRNTRPSSAAREWQKIEYLIQDEDLVPEVDETLDDSSVSKKGLTDEQRLILMRLCVANADFYCDKGFFTLIGAAFYRHTKVRHGTLKRVVETLTKKWKTTFKAQGSETGEELDTPESLVMREWLDLEKDKIKKKDKKSASEAAEAQAHEASAAVKARHNMLRSQKRKQLDMDPSSDEDAEGNDDVIDVSDGEAVVGEGSGSTRISAGVQSSSIAPSESISEKRASSAKKKRKAQSTAYNVNDPLAEALIKFMDNQVTEKAEFGQVKEELKDVKQTLAGLAGIVPLMNQLVQQQQQQALVWPNNHIVGQSEQQDNNSDLSWLQNASF